MVTQAKFHITTKNGRQRATWLELFGTDVLPVTAAQPREVFYRDGRSEWVYDLDTAALSEHACRRLAAYIAARKWGMTFEAALTQIRKGWTIKAADCELVDPETTPSIENPHGEGPETAARPSVLKNGRARSPRQNSRQRRVYGRSVTPQIIPSV